jgi:hypothetical protein
MAVGCVKLVEDDLVKVPERLSGGGEGGAIEKKVEEIAPKVIRLCADIVQGRFTKSSSISRLVWSYIPIEAVEFNDMSVERDPVLLIQAFKAYIEKYELTKQHYYNFMFGDLGFRFRTIEVDEVSLFDLLSSAIKHKNTNLYRLVKNQLFQQYHRFNSETDVQYIKRKEFFDAYKSEEKKSFEGEKERKDLTESILNDAILSQNKEVVYEMIREVLPDLEDGQFEKLKMRLEMNNWKFRIHESFKTGEKNLVFLI